MSERRLLGLLREAERREPVIRVELDWHTLAVLIAQLQLALAHPDNPPVPARKARDWIDHVLKYVSTVSPDLADYLASWYDRIPDVK